MCRACAPVPLRPLQAALVHDPIPQYDRPSHPTPDLSMAAVLGAAMEHAAKPPPQWEVRGGPQFPFSSTVQQFSALPDALAALELADRHDLPAYLIHLPTGDTVAQTSMGELLAPFRAA